MSIATEVILYVDDTMEELEREAYGNRWELEPELEREYTEELSIYFAEDDTNSGKPLEL